MSEKSLSYNAYQPTAILDLLRDLKEHWYHGFNHPPQLIEITLAASTLHMVHDEIRAAIASFMHDYDIPRSSFKVRSEPIPEHRLVITH